MTEKRFKLDSEVGFIDTQQCGGDTMTLFEVVVELNKLNEENEKLRFKNRGLQSELQIFKEDATHSNLQINKLADENDELKNEIEKLSYANDDLLEEKRIWKQMSDEYTKLSYENKQLKQKIKSINEILNEDTGYIESLRKIEEVLK